MKFKKSRFLGSLPEMFFFGKKMEDESPKIIEKTREKIFIIFLVGIQKMFFSVFQVFFSPRWAQNLVWKTSFQRLYY